jgi:predicted permease
MNTLAAGLVTRFPERQAGWGITVRGLKEDLVGEVKTSLLLVFAAVGLVLLVAGANVADLQLTTTIARQQEIAVRAALGAGRGRLFRQLLLEGLCIAGAGGLVGLLLAQWAITGLVASAPGVPRLDAIGLDLGVVGFAALVTAGCALAFGLAPAAGLSQQSLSGWLAHRAATARAGAQVARRLLVGAQVAFSFILLVGAALLIRSMANRLGVDLGLRPEGVAVANLSLPGPRFPEAVDRERFYEELVGRVAGLPGVTVASAGSLVPMSGGGQATSFRPLDRPAPAPGEAPVADVRFVHHAYHEAMGIGLLQGRLLGAPDGAGAPTVVLINETGARRLWPGESAVGKRIEMEWGDTLDAEVVGVVRDVHLVGPDIPVDRVTLYWDYRQAGVPGAMSLVVKTASDPTSLLALIRSAARDQDPAIPLYGLGTMSGLLVEAVAKARFTTMAFGLFAALALLLATIGLYGVMASATQQRTREIGIRMALGASGRTVRGMILRDGLRVVGPAILIGAAVSAGLAGLLRSLVFGVSPTDPGTFVLVTALLAATAAAACWIPARRASSVDPVEAIRSE